jgi:hypothetical protein
VGAGALLASQAVVFTSWADARYATIANLVLLVGVVWGFLSEGPGSFRARYARDLSKGRAGALGTLVLTEADLAQLPAVVQRYVRRSGAVGQPRVRNFRARFHGQIRSGPNATWMSFTGRQDNSYHPPSRLFLMDGIRAGVPFQAFHRFIGACATMRVKVASVATVVDARGPQLDEAETVTLFNDLCVFAPGALIDPGIRWQGIDEHTVRAWFTHADRTIGAVLSFNDRGELTNFIADGRGAGSADGKSFTTMPWSTPLTDYRRFGSHRLMEHGQGIWHTPAGEYSYLRFTLDSIEYNVAALSIQHHRRSAPDPLPRGRPAAGDGRAPEPGAPGAEPVLVNFHDPGP